MTLTREQIYTIIREFNCGDGYDAYERANQATDEIWDLVEPTVREDGKMLKSALYSPTDVGRDEALAEIDTTLAEAGA